MLEFWIFVLAGAVVVQNILLGSIATDLSRMERNSKKTADAVALLAEIANIKRG